jgi:7,8-dihydropterin-6-yl-methyl-4-(beta-D-ribofuranosyl)aminobenzene 5'-phosphate synthase
LVSAAILLAVVIAGLGDNARAADPELEIRVIYDNTSAREDVKEDWGFSSVVTFRGRRVLFDSGTDPDLFMTNLAKMDVAPASIEKAIISHEHRDHRSGVYKLFPLNRRMSVHFLDAFLLEAYDQAQAIGMKPARETGPFEVVPGAYSTGKIDGSPPEQSLAVETSQGIVLLVGCSHPGIVKIVETVRKQRGADSIRLVLGGFHMFQQEEPQIREQVAALRRLNVRRVMPAHCSGDLAKKIFAEVYGSDYEPLGAGKVLRLD